VDATPAALRPAYVYDLADQAWGSRRR
jgi:hypothetical protein